ncbi:MAG: hypothetical protein HY027_06775, partial [Deltaproteobacteria bacterium]|nr:hypothetical protein [Deltaproteobacteria bacterium]
MWSTRMRLNLFAMTCLLAVVALVAPPPAHAVSKTFTGAMSADWFNGGNWNPAGAPAIGDDVILASGTLDLSGANATVATYTQTGGTFTGSANLTVSGVMTWQAGLIRGTGSVNANGGLVLSTTTTITLFDTRTLNNAGVATWTGPGTFSLGGNAIFNNLMGATFQIKTAADMGAGTFNNHGMVTKELGSGDGITVLSSFFTDSGMLKVLSGTLQLAGDGLHQGTTTVMAGAGLAFTGGDHTVSGSLTSPDTIGFTGGTITFTSGSTYSVGTQTLVTNAAVTFAAGANATLSNTLKIEGGSLTLNTGMAKTVTTYMQTAGTLTGADDLTVTGVMTWQAGLIRGTGNVNANGGLLLSTTSTITLFDTRTLNNAGVATWSGPGAFSIGGNAIFNNVMGATFQIKTAADMGAGTFNNHGMVTKELGSGDGITVLSSFFTDSGMLKVLSGTLQLAGDGLHQGTTTVMAGAGLAFTGGDHMVSGSLTSPDTI